MNIFMKSLKVKNAVNSIFNLILFLSLFIFSGAYLEAAAPTVIGSIPNQQAHNGDFFDMSFDIYQVFDDADNDDLSVTVTQADDSALPTWLTAEAKPLTPSLVGAYDTPDLAHGLTVVGNYVYIADYASGLQIIDVSTPSSPSLIGTYDTSGSARGVTVVGNYAYVGDDVSGLQIIDVSTPSSPSLVGTYDTPHVADGLTVVGNYAYVADGTAGLQIIDVSTPSSPILVGTYDTPGMAYALTVVGNYAYIADGTAGLQIIDVSTPSSPSLVGTYDTSGSADRVTVVDNYAYVGDGSSGLQIIDVSSPSSPSLVGAYDTPGYVREVTVVSNYAYVADDTSGLQIIDISTPSSPSLVGTYDTPGRAIGVAVVGDYAYVADYASGLQIIDVIKDGIQLEGMPGDSDVGVLNLKATASDGVDAVSTTFSIDVTNSAPVVVGSIPDQQAHEGEPFSMSFDIFEVFSDADNDDLNITVTQADDSELPAWLTSVVNPLAPSLVGAYDTPGDAVRVAVVGDYAYIADYLSGLQIIDVSTPSSPSLVGTYDTPGYAQGVTVVGNYAYVADASSGLQIIDVSTPSSPSLVGAYDTSGSADEVTVVGNYAYIADASSGLQIIDVSVPASPSLVGTYDTPGSACGITVVGNYAFIADDASGLQIIDVSTPSSPSLVGTYDTSDRAIRVAVVDNYAYVGDWDSGLQIIDISTPSNPSLVGTYDTTGAAWEVTVVGNYAYVADYNSGLQIIDVRTPSTPILVGTYDTPGIAKGVAVVGDYAYVADGTSGLQIIEGIRREVKFEGTPSASDVGLLNLKATASDGVDAVSTTFSIDVTGDAPIVTDVPKSGTEDTTLTFTASDFTDHFSDYNEDPLTKIQVTSLPNPDHGVLKLSDVDVTLDQEILVGDLGNLTFDPDANWNGDTSFTWKGFDGIEYSVAAANVNITISAEQDAPTVSDVSKSGTEDTTLTFIASDFTDHFSDVDFDNLTKIQVTSLPDNGTLQLSDVPVTLDQEILVGDLGNLTFDPDANWNGDTSFSWKGNDGIEYSAETANVNITISAENDPPIVSDVSKSGTEDTTLTFTTSDFTDHFSDVDFDNLTKIQITSLPDNGTLKLFGISIPLNQEIVVGDLGDLTFDPDADWNGETSFAWKGYDGTEYSATAANVNITISAENDPPIVSDVSKSGSEDTTVTFAAEDFTSHFSDVDGDSLTKIQITSLPENGTLELSGVSVTLDQEILVEDLGDLTFDPDADWSGDTSFSWKGHDGTEYSFDAANVNIQINPNNPPTVNDVTKSGDEGTTVTFTSEDFTDHFSDVDGDSLTKIQITSLPENGTLELLGEPVELNQEILVEDLEDLTFEPDAEWSGDTSFAWKGHDGTEYSVEAANVNIQITDIVEEDSASTYSQWCKFGL